MTIEFPEYLICPNCKDKIHIDYNVGKLQLPKTDDLLCISLNFRHIRNPGASRERRKEYFGQKSILICNHCGAIIGCAN